MHHHTTALPPQATMQGKLLAFNCFHFFNLHQYLSRHASSKLSWFWLLNRFPCAKSTLLAVREAAMATNKPNRCLKFVLKVTQWLAGDRFILQFFIVFQVSVESTYNEHDSHMLLIRYIHYIYIAYSMWTSHYSRTSIMWLSGDCTKQLYNKLRTIGTFA